MLSSLDSDEVELSMEQADEEAKSSFRAWRKEFCIAHGWVGVEGRLQLKIKKSVCPYKNPTVPKKDDLQLDEQDKNILTFKQATDLCKEKLGFRVSPKYLERLVTKRGGFPHLVASHTNSYGTKNKVFGINANRWIGFLNGRCWAKTIHQLFSNEE